LRVAVYHNNHDIRLEQRPCPEIGPGELLLRIEASGICGSDAMEWYRLPKAPLVLGHEVAGVVEQVGDGVAAFRPGDRIVTTHHVPCGSCRYCRTDRHSVCDTLRTTSFDPGGFSEYVRLPAINVESGTFCLPDDVSFEEGSFVEPLACVVRAQRLIGIPPDGSVVVLGSGISGLMMIQMARVNGAGPIVATDVSEPRLKAARRLGADVALHASADIAAEVRARNEGRLAERVIVCTGARAAFDQALELVDLGGTIQLFAPLDPGETPPFPGNELWKRGVTLAHSYAGPPGDMRTALRLISERRVDVGAMITHRLPLAETAEGFRLLMEGADALKVIIEPQR